MSFHQECLNEISFKASSKNFTKQITEYMYTINVSETLSVIIIAITITYSEIIIIMKLFLIALL